jgi:hypothetical protein
VPPRRIAAACTGVLVREGPGGAPLPCGRAPDAGRFTFPSDRDAADDFFTTRLLTDVSDAVVIEGDSPLRDADLRVFVAPPPAAGQALLVRERRDRAAQQRAQADAMERLLGEPDGAARLLDQLMGGPLVAFA